MSYTSFRKIVWNYYAKHGRHDLPWRKTRSPYRILVSEIMLQQTQVDRVRPFYSSFLKRFPTPERLARAPLADVLRAWQGLGYNRRAKLLHQAARHIVRDGMPDDVLGFTSLPGVGSYTAGAIAAFAYNLDGIFVETNIRTAVIHHFFPTKQRVSDADIEKVLARAFSRGKARIWHWALMDYGAHLKRTGVRLNHRSLRYAKQKPFAGSRREARGAILRTLADGEAGRSQILTLLGKDRIPQVESALTLLEKEGLIGRSGRKFSLAQ